ncbi:TfoX family protein [Hanamia caeni]|jgi:TfoX/Sxy family transcriptional regulator of competence genes|uniref:TfoX family protein n=1 Tax=Hanamia caeni TaxID=2294116 RepID=A0A3M9N7R9_9BACT|nr:TfoX/Sxy family protein [Hanamia caeni]RNI33862.1 TfoX family protein [Hanamia caeni]
MAYNTNLAERVRKYLAKSTSLIIQEKKMFSGLAFIVNGKMCINISNEKLMCRFDPGRENEVADKPGYEPLIMKGRQLTGYCYVNSAGYSSQKDLEFWVDLCLMFNDKAKASKKKKS